MHELSFLYFGDIVGRPGRTFLTKYLPKLQAQYHPTFIFANGENAAGGFGITRPIAEEINKSGVHGISLGNHTWDQNGFWHEIDRISYLCRPANLPEACPGKTYIVVENQNVKVALFGLLGRSFMNTPLNCPFKTAEKILEKIKDQSIHNIIVDVHAETTAEKYALGWFLNKHAVTSVLGTHTHVQTADAHLMHQSTAFITDLGMCGAAHGILGFRVEPVIEKLMCGKPTRFEVAAGPSMLNGVWVKFNASNGQATYIERISIAEM
ncbi:MAG: YmdB family metallophosphoesterase [Puniceicoccales bacterium]|jgi:metallophosphoesterase (TIGR00282 family)|nr:YmdB family metallophosphoesterase [Puniceicoccales bacterium]